MTAPWRGLIHVDDRSFLIGKHDRELCAQQEALDAAYTRLFEAAYNVLAEWGPLDEDDYEGDGEWHALNAALAEVERLRGEP